MKRGLAIGFALAGCAVAQQEGQDKVAFEMVCGACHSVTLVADLKSQPEWRETVDNMVEHGAKGTPEQLAAVMRHLARNFSRVNINSAEAAEIAPVLGVEQRIAQAVVDYRSHYGTFKSLDDLKKVPGLPVARLEFRRERIVFQ